MVSKVLLLMLLTSTLLLTDVISIEIGPDGGYSGIVIKISEDVPEELCDDILQKIQVRWISNFSRSRGSIFLIVIMDNRPSNGLE